MGQITGDQYWALIDRLTALERDNVRLKAAVAELQGKPVAEPPKPIFEAAKAQRHKLGCICAECERETREFRDRRADLIRRRT